MYGTLNSINCGKQKLFSGKPDIKEQSKKGEDNKEKM
jgi:hypothetical protein